MKRLTDDIYLDPAEVCAIEKEEIYRDHSMSPSGSDFRCEFRGSVVVLKNGRKIFVKDMTPTDIYYTLGLRT